jgi:hypothetical protein
VLRVQRFRIETGYYATGDAIGLARGLAATLLSDPQIKWVSYSENATGRFFGATRIKANWRVAVAIALAGARCCRFWPVSCSPPASRGRCTV